MKITELQISPTHKLSPQSRFQAMRRLLRLAACLVDRDRRHHRKFDFGMLCRKADKGCGTVGCAIGELPYTFPQHFRIARDSADSTDVIRFRHAQRDACPLGARFNESFYVTATFFGLNGDQIRHLFAPYGASPGTIEQYGGRRLIGSATAAQVARQIVTFVKSQYRDLL